MTDRLVAAEVDTADFAETQIRPQTLAEFVGQPRTCDNLRIFVDAARADRQGR